MPTVKRSLRGRYDEFFTRAIRQKNPVRVPADALTPVHVHRASVACAALGKKWYGKIHVFQSNNNIYAEATK